MSLFSCRVCCVWGYVTVSETVLLHMGSAWHGYLAIHPFSSECFEKYSIHLFLNHSCASLNTSYRKHIHTFISLWARMSKQMKSSHGTPSPAVMESSVASACEAFLSHCSHTLHHTLNYSGSPSDV